MKRPGLFNTDAVGILSDSEGLSYSAVLSLDNSSLEHLDSLAVALDVLTRGMSISTRQRTISYFTVYDYSICLSKLQGLNRIFFLVFRLFSQKLLQEELFLFGEHRILQ